MNTEFLRDLTHVVDPLLFDYNQSIWQGFKPEAQKTVISISLIGTKIIANILSRSAEDVLKLNERLVDDRIFNLKLSVGQCNADGKAYLDYACIAAIGNEIRLRGKLSESEKAEQMCEEFVRRKFLEVEDCKKVV